jgi:signal transduction histidine kinase
MFDVATLRGRLTLAYAGALMLALIVFAAGTLAILDIVQHRLLDSELTAVARAEASMVDVSADGTIDPVDRQRFVSAAGRRVASMVVLPDGRELVTSTADVSGAVARIAATADHPFTTTLKDQHEHLRATFVPIVNAGKRVAVIAVWSGVETIGTLDRKLGVAFAIAIPLFAILAAVAGSAIAARGLAPLEQIIADASEIEAHETHARVRLPHTRELSRLATTLNRMLERLNDAFERERRFTGDASHELRAPLAIIMAEADLALAADRTPDQYRHAIETIALEADALEGLTRRLLATARATAGESAPVQVADLADVARSVAARTRRLAAARGVTIGTSLAPDAVVAGGADDIEEAVLTIVHNAIKHASLQGTISIDVAVRAADVELRVGDDGSGFSAAALEHAFDRFWREATDDGAATGHGLGLSIAHAIVERYSGSLALENRDGGGAVVTMRLPRAAHDGSPKRSPQS